MATSICKGGRKRAFGFRLRDGTPLQYSCLEDPMDRGAWWAAVHGVAKSQTRLSNFTFTFHFHALEKEMATHSVILAWKIPWTEEPGGLQSIGSQRVGHDWVTKPPPYVYMDIYWWRMHLAMQRQKTGVWSWVGKIPCRRKWQSTPGLLPRKFHRLQSTGSQKVGYDWAHTHTQVYNGTLLNHK